MLLTIHFSEISLVDANYTIDETIGTKTISLKNLSYSADDKDTRTIHFNKVNDILINVFLRNKHKMSYVNHPIYFTDYLKNNAYVIIKPVK